MSIDYPDKGCLPLIRDVGLNGLSHLICVLCTNTARVVNWMYTKRGDYDSWLSDRQQVWGECAHLGLARMLYNLRDIDENGVGYE